ncbi:MAG: alpha-2-macroglobulin family protein [Calditrichaeota bacterium]|nr:MAG: alpha-2-macroglobulin family protein [Calditrichota bacterium]MBL1206010.1 alpha-2-macroglobulin family protein [Calditrichota bacterium]NOG45838.1 alpha-2-macroglobulin family protein [Calditrichota bacterium]
MRNSIKSILAFLSIIFFLFISCEKTDTAKISEEIDMETAKTISHLPLEVMEPDGLIKIRFVNPVVDEKKIGASDLEDVFEFDPAIEGALSWQDKRTLVLKPTSGLIAHENYSGSIVLENVDADKFKGMEPVNFEFRVAGQELTSFDGDFELAEKGNPKKVYYAGTINFALNADPKVIGQYLIIKKGGVKVGVKVEAGSGTNQITFKTDIITRNNIEKNFRIELINEELKLPSAFFREIKLAALQDLRINNIKKDESGGQPRVKIDFSDELDREQNIDGFISIEPKIDFTFRKMGKSVLINAPFEYGKTYTFDVQKGIASKWATKTKTLFHEIITFEDLLPEIKFSKSGVFLPSTNLQKVAFMSVNVRRVEISVTQVFENNIGQFLQEGNLDGNKNRNNRFWGIERVGVTLATQDLEIGDTKNRWLQHEVDLSNLIKPTMKGLFILSLRFERNDMIWDSNANSEYSSYRNRRNRYGDPGSYYYINNKGRIFKPVILSDIGLTYKKLDGKAIVYATNLLNTDPLENVKIRLRTYQNQVIAERVTNNSGIAEFEKTDKTVFYIEGERDGQQSIIKINEMAWNISNFDVSGKQRSSGGINAFTFTERGVYRPGDTVNVSIIVRNKSGTFPDDHPVTMKIKNPLDQLVHTKTLKKAKDGFYSFRFNTSPQDPTGNYNAQFSTGGANFAHTVKIETVVPERLKIKLETSPEKITFEQRKLNLDIQTNYLFGNPAANLETNVNVTVRDVPVSFAKYPGFTFKAAHTSFQEIDQNVSRKKLDANGHLNINWKAPDFSKAPGLLRASFNVKVFEKGGRFAQKDISVPIEPFKYFVGAQKPDLKWGYARIGRDIEIPVILVNNEGQSVSGKPLRYKIYRNERYWWWEYNSRDQYRMRYKSDSSTDLEKEGQLISGTMPTILTYKPEESGQYLVEVYDDSPGGHVTSFFISAYRWGENPEQQKNAGTLVLKTDKEKYAPGDEAVVTFPVPEKGAALVTVEKGRDVLTSTWHKLEKGKNELSINISVTEKMLPTAYVSVSVIQPHSETTNDRPIRTYGVVPLNVADPATEQEVFIKMGDELETGKPFEVEIQTADKNQTQFTVAVVDEGLLQLTRFKTPEPWKHFYSKERLGVLTYDLYGHILGANHGDIFRTFSIGGGMEMDKMSAEEDEDKTAKRFKAVSMFEGPLQTDRNGHAKVSFKMPDYIGAVRVMVVAANNARYGNTEKTVPVKSDLMLMPTLPRVLGPEDEISVPVTVFPMRENLGDTKVTLEVDGPIEVMGAISQQLNFAKPEDKDLLFKIKAKAGVGIAAIKITAKSSRASAEYETEIQVRTSSDMEYLTEEKTVKPGDKLTMNIPGNGIAGSNQATLTIRRTKDLNFGKRLYRLIRYPYGCIEQTTSSIFPQLYLEKFIPKSSLAKKDIDDNINKGIKRLRKFKLPSGAFGYWPGAKTPSMWGTNYAGHFMIEAKRKGYHVPDDLMNDWIKFQKSQALLTSGNIKTRIYRLYLLALAGEPIIGPMNLIRESSLSALKDVERWMLASAYKLAGVESEANTILKSTGFFVKLYREFSGTYGSSDRDKAMILDQVVQFQQYERANKLVDELATLLRSKSWLSTQESAFILLAMGKYLNATSTDDQKPISGKVTLPTGEKVAFNFEGATFDLPVEEGFGDNLSIELDNSTKAKRVFAILNWSGQPLKSTQKDESKNLELDIQWLDESGRVINPANVKQGTTFWGRYSVKVQNSRLTVEELALTQILPAGWEIENLRLNQSDLPSWTRNYKLKKAEYEDIRDDRISWFFDQRGYEKQKDFLVKINAVTVGEFFLPGATFNAMYDNEYRATKSGKTVVVTGR